MTRLLSACAVIGLLSVFSAPADAGQRADGVRNADQYEFSSNGRKRYGYRTKMHYYDPAPWWWYEPYAYRARTYYQPWPVAPADPHYDLPHPSGVVGYTVIGPWNYYGAYRSYYY